MSSDKHGVPGDATSEPDGGLSASSDAGWDATEAGGSSAAAGSAGAARPNPADDSAEAAATSGGAGPDGAGGAGDGAVDGTGSVEAELEDENASSLGGPGLGRTAADDMEGQDVDAEELQPAGVAAGRVSAGSARAAARASAAATRPAASPSKGRATPSRERGAGRGNIFQRIGRFLREVVAELRKVIWPTRREMVTYTIVVIVFVTFMVALVWSLDLLFAKSVLWIFG